MRGRVSRRSVIGGCAGAIVSACAPQAGTAGDGFTIWGPPAGPSMVLAYAERQGLLAHVSQDARVSAWRSPDELRAGLTSNRIGLSIMPLNTAANLYNRGRDIRLVNIMTRGLLYVVSADASISDIASLAGKRLAVPYRKDAPEIVLRRLLAHAGLNADSDVELRFTGSPIEATQLLIVGQVDAAFVPEPAVSAAIAAGGLVGKELRRVIDVQRAWQTVAGADASLPQAGLAVSGAFLRQYGAEIVRLQNVLVEAAAATNADPHTAALAAASMFGLPQSVLESSAGFSNLVAVSATEARPEVERYFAAIHELDTDILGGRLPDGDFYLA